MRQRGGIMLPAIAKGGSGSEAKGGIKGLLQRGVVCDGNDLNNVTYMSANGFITL